MKKYFLYSMVFTLAMLIGCDREDKPIVDDPEGDGAVELLNGAVIVDNNPDITILPVGKYPESDLVATQPGINGTSGIAKLDEEYSANEYKFLHTLNVPTISVTVEGKKIETQASHVKIVPENDNGGYVFVAYNKQHEGNYGGVVLYKYTITGNQAEPVSLVAHAMLEMKNPEVSFQVNAIDYSKNHKKLFVAGATNEPGWFGFDDETTPAIFMAIQLDGSMKFRTDVEPVVKQTGSYQTTSVAIYWDWVYFTSGDNKKDGTSTTAGGLRMYNANTLEQEFFVELYDARSVDVADRGVYVLLGDGASPKGISGFYHDGRPGVTGYTETEEMQKDAKSDIVLWKDCFFLALNKAGMRMLIINSGIMGLNYGVLAPNSEYPPCPGNGIDCWFDQEDVTNSLFVNDDVKKAYCEDGKAVDIKTNLLLVANGRQGMYWYDIVPDGDGGYTLAGGSARRILRDNGSTNHVESKGNVVFVASGAKGLDVLFIEFENCKECMTDPEPDPGCTCGKGCNGGSDCTCEKNCDCGKGCTCGVGCECGAGCKCSPNCICEKECTCGGGEGCTCGGNCTCNATCTCGGNGGPDCTCGGTGCTCGTGGCDCGGNCTCGANCTCTPGNCTCPCTCDNGCNGGEKCTCDEKCDCGAGCPCGKGCVCGAGCKCNPACTCDECTCDAGCNAGEKCSCGEKCDCGAGCPCGKGCTCGAGCKCSPDCVCDLPSQPGIDFITNAKFYTTLITTGAALKDGKVWVWGFRNSGQQGTGKRAWEAHAVPMPANIPDDVVTFTGGAYHLLALTVKGEVYGWGQNGYGETGTKSNEGIYVHTPDKVTFPAGAGKIVQIGAGEYCSIALDDLGNVYTWGHNLYGQIGDGKHANITNPVKVTLPAKARLIGAAYEGAFAVLENNSVWGWGDNEARGLGFQTKHGLGYGVQDVVRTPTEAVNLRQYASRIVHIAGGNGWGEALLNDGSVIGWGVHASLGQGLLATGTSSHVPVQILPNKDFPNVKVKQLFARYVGSVALTENGELITWGQTHGSAFPMIYQASPTLRNTNGPVVEVGGGKEHVFYMKADGSLWGVGYNDINKIDLTKPAGIISTWPGTQIKHSKSGFWN